jgi:hypothetical protein
MAVRGVSDLPAVEVSDLEIRRRGRSFSIDNHPEAAGGIWVPTMI